MTPSPPPAGEPERDDELERRLRGRTQTVLTYTDATADPRPLVGLYEEVRRVLGATSTLALLVEYHAEELYSRTRSVAESARVWAQLHARAELALDRHDTTLMGIKALHARYARLSGGPADLDTAAQTYEVEWRRRLAILGAKADRTSTAHANLAIALRDRGGRDDLRRACQIAREEVTVRHAVWGADHSFTWIAQLILAQTLLKVAERADPPGHDAGPPALGPADGSAAIPGPGSEPVDPDAWRSEHDRYPPVSEDDLARPRDELIEEGRVVAAAVLTARQERFGATSDATLRTQLVHAHALLLAGEPSRAAAEIRYVLATNRRVGANLDPGWPELLLARALLAAVLSEEGDSLDDALRQARAAVEARRARYPAGAQRVAEAEHFEREARRLAAEQPPDE
ncbi:hypothetical protein [Pseudofrankia sp. BMG5.37]|uniref:hypothetical protein n=1 Tax=Pseudofrankia sp. BMG5.37 TaxID=3050035 RepID=UPI002895E5B3|nr:hypothetical protein [Pseudofrankia sp. BMG5.37]MDT3438252.1 hypothetical protein [Pseudofrankia sp. BMG5.37]